MSRWVEGYTAKVGYGVGYAWNDWGLGIHIHRNAYAGIAFFLEIQLLCFYAWLEGYTNG